MGVNQFFQWERKAHAIGWIWRIALEVQAQYGREKKGTAEDFKTRPIPLIRKSLRQCLGATRHDYGKKVRKINSETLYESMIEACSGGQYSAAYISKKNPSRGMSDGIIG